MHLIIGPVNVMDNLNRSVGAIIGDPDASYRSVQAIIQAVDAMDTPYKPWML